MGREEGEEGGEGVGEEGEEGGGGKRRRLIGGLGRGEKRGCIWCS